MPAWAFAAIHFGLVAVVMVSTWRWGYHAGRRDAYRDIAEHIRDAEATPVRGRQN